MYINVGAPGRCNDSRIFECSSLKKYHSENNILEAHSKIINGMNIPVLLIGDSAFRLSSMLMKPFPFGLERTEKEKKFNKNLSKCRRVVENAFGHLKARFRRLGKCLENNIKNVNIIIKACCVLHNFLNEEKDNVLHQWIIDAESAEKSQPDPITVVGDNDTNNLGNNIRNTIAEALCKYISWGLKNVFFYI